MVVNFPPPMTSYIVGDGVVHMSDGHFAGVFSDLERDDWVAVYITPDGFSTYKAKEEPE